MYCEKCGDIIEAKKDPWCMYQMVNGKVVNQLFDPKKIPKGWFDSPGAARKAEEKKKLKEEAAKKETFTEESHDNSARLCQ